MGKIIFHITSILIVPLVLYFLIKKDKAYGNPKIAFWDLANFMSYFLMIFPEYKENTHNIYFIIRIGQFIMVSALARYFIDKEKKRFKK